MSFAGDLVGIIAGIADGLLLGIPSSATLSTLSDEYNVEMHELRGIYNKVAAAFRQDTEALETLRSKRLSMDNLLQSYPELNLLAEHYANKRGAMLEQEAKLKEKVEGANQKLDSLEREIQNKAQRQSTATFGSVAKRFIETGDTK